ncbi:hypothetical protein A9G42_00070 [Gilliamella sp. Nev6-6]|nr:hypothetical protein A9G42_00070 [Gilliamella apicola]
MLSTEQDAVFSETIQCRCLKTQQQSRIAISYILQPYATVKFRPLLLERYHQSLILFANGSPPKQNYCKKTIPKQQKIVKK